jgi:hypothetical protein
LKAETLDRTVWRTRFGRGRGPVVRRTADWTSTEEAPLVTPQCFEVGAGNRIHFSSADRQRRFCLLASTRNSIQVAKGR